jgi:hypothetical protein
VPHIHDSTAPRTRRGGPAPAVTDHPVYWFALMEHARERGDFESAAHAKGQLERLGIRVTYGRMPTGPGEGGSHVA